MNKIVTDIGGNFRDIPSRTTVVNPWKFQLYARPGYMGLSPDQAVWGCRRPRTSGAPPGGRTTRAMPEGPLAPCLASRVGALVHVEDLPGDVVEQNGGADDGGLGDGHVRLEERVGNFGRLAVSGWGSGERERGLMRMGCSFGMSAPDADKILEGAQTATTVRRRKGGCDAVQAVLVDALAPARVELECSSQLNDPRRTACVRNDRTR